MNQYIIIPRLIVSNANAQPVWWMIGPPPITAYLGFAHALALNLRANTHAGIAIVHHDIQFLGERFERMGDTLLPHQYRAASFIDASDYSSKNPHVLSSQPTARCHLCVSVVIRLADEASFRLGDVARFLRGGRLAGGAIIEHGKPVYAPDDKELATAVPKIGSGFSITSRQDLMVPAEGDRDTLDTLLRLTRITGERTEDQKWLLPTALGYLEITPRKPRRHVRGEFPHAYAEPLVGLVQYRSLRRAGMHFWRYEHPQPSITVAATDAA